MRPAHSVPVESVPVIPAQPQESSRRAKSGSTEVSWPASGAVDVEVGAEATRAGELPVWVSGRSGRARVEVLERSGGEAPVLRVGGAAGPVTLEVDYSGFRQAFGGDWASRLQVVRLPERTPVESRNDGSRLKVSLDLPPDGDRTTVQAAGEPGGVLLALVASAGSSVGQGTYAASPLAPSASWQVSQQTGDFSWSYPLKSPPVPGGLTPKLSVGYSSSRVDGRTASTNNQPSWLGEGWDMWSGYVERRFTSCAENTDVAADKTADKCWFDENASVVLAGQSGQIVRDDATGVLRLKNDDGSLVERLFGAANGDQDGEYWRITKGDGTRYYFGRNRLDGWSAGNPETRSAWTVPVFGRYDGQPCHAALFKDSWCQRAWRWNLDYVVDKHGNSMTYYYDPETNFYGRNKNEAATQYVRGGTVARVEYGTREGTEYQGEAPAKVVFETAERCVAGSPCAPADYPDVPGDQRCDGGTCPDRVTPTFWSTKRLARVVTRITTPSGPKDVESWSFNHSFPDTGDSTSAALWLTGITHTGLAGGTTALPEVTFEGKRLANRVGTGQTDWGGYFALYKYRITHIYSESGGLVALDYRDSDCDRANPPPSADTNTQRCYPVTWAPPDRGEFVDWFSKYVVRAVTETDRVGGSPDQVTTYDYVGDPAWAYTEDEITPERLRTWSEWRGYQRVRTTKAGRQTERLFYRGLHGGRLSTGTRTDQLTDSQGGVVDDIKAAQGFQREELTRNGTGGLPLLITLTTPWTRRTAQDGLLEAYLTRPGQSRTFTALSSGGFRSTTSTPTFNDDGVVTDVDDRGDDATADDDLCVHHTYAGNPARGLRYLNVRTETVGKACGATVLYPNDLVSDARTYYDGSLTHGVVPGAGDATKVEQAASYENGEVVYKQVSRSVYDARGRITESYDPLDRKSTTVYTETSGLLTRQVIGNAKGFTATVDLDPAWGEPLTKTDANNGVTKLTYDPLGRLASVQVPNRAAWYGANTKFSYEVNKNAATAVATTSVNATNAKMTSYALYDGLLRPRQTQQPGPYQGRQLTDTFYDASGLVGRTASLYYDDTSDPSKDLKAPPPGNQVDLPSQTINTYDTLGRLLTQTFRGLGQDKWTSTMSYGGDRVAVTPPPGGTATTKLTDARGRTTELWQHEAPTPTGAHDVTRWATSGARPTTCAAGQSRSRTPTVG